MGTASTTARVRGARVAVVAIEVGARIRLLTTGVAAVPAGAHGTHDIRAVRDERHGVFQTRAVYGIAFAAVRSSGVAIDESHAPERRAAIPVQMNLEVPTIDERAINDRRVADPKVIERRDKMIAVHVAGNIGVPATHRTAHNARDVRPARGVFNTSAIGAINRAVAVVINAVRAVFGTIIVATIDYRSVAPEIDEQLDRPVGVIHDRQNRLNVVHTQPSWREIRTRKFGARA